MFILDSNGDIAASFERLSLDTEDIVQRALNVLQEEIDVSYARDCALKI